MTLATALVSNRVHQLVCRIVQRHGADIGQIEERDVGTGSNRDAAEAIAKPEH